MSSLEQVQQLLPTLTRGEKAQILQWVARDLANDFPGIDLSDGQTAFIVRTRIPVWLLVQARQLGMRDADLLANYPTLRAEDLVNAWAYYRAYRQDIDEAIRENEEA